MSEVSDWNKQQYLDEDALARPQDVRSSLPKQRLMTSARSEAIPTQVVLLCPMRRIADFTGLPANGGVILEGPTRDDGMVDMLAPRAIEDLHMRSSRF